jgi:type VI secretion system protein VasD
MTRLIGRCIRRLSPLVSVVALLVSCSSGPPLVQGTIKAEPAVNPDRGGRPSPIVVRVYELKAVAAFNGADFFALYDKEQETIGGDLVGREEFLLQPSESRQYRRQFQPDTKFIGVIGAYRDLEQSRWRQVVPVPAKGKATLTIGVQARAITLEIK